MDFHEELVNFHELPLLIERANTATGIMPAGKAFPRDILRIEISGPDRPHLTIVDLPGVIHSENKNQSEEDVQRITDIVKEYMKQPRSAILAVISAKNDYPNQIFLNLARKADLRGLRTLGVITKPDSLKSGSASEKTYLSLAGNLEVSFHHGWHVLRNRDTDADDWKLDERDAKEEQFFETSRWKSLKPSQLGIRTRRDRLSKPLLHQIVSELTNLRNEIAQKLDDCEAELAKLGNSRETTTQQRLYPIQISLDFQALLKAAVDGSYDDAFFGQADSHVDYEKRFRAVIQKKNAEFAKEHATSGDFYFNAPDNTKIVPSPRQIIKRDYLNQTKTMMSRNKGRELPGMFNPLVVTELFQKQSSPWQGITNEHSKAV